MANTFKVNSNYTVKKFSNNFGEMKPKVVNPNVTTDKLDTQYNNLQESLSAAGQVYDNRNWMEKILGINSDTKQHAGVLRGTLDIVTRPLDAIKATVFDLETGKGGGDILNDLVQGITKGKGKNLTGTQVLGLENAHLDTFTKFIVNAGVDIGLDPLTYIPAGAIFKGLKATGSGVAKLPVVSELLEHVRGTELGVAARNLYISTKNQFGKMFKWMYGTSEEGKFLFSKYEADKMTTTSEAYARINHLLDTTKEAADDIFNYVHTNQLPGSKSFMEVFPNAKKGREELDNIVERLGIENPENTFKKWADIHYNGNIEEAKNNFLKFITDSKNKSFRDDWEAMKSTGAVLNPDGSIKNEAELISSFWKKKTTEWQQLTKEEVRIRLNEAIYHEYLLANPAEKTLNTVIKALNNGQFPISVNDPEAIQQFLRSFSHISGIEDPLLNAKYIRRTLRNSDGKIIKTIDNDAVIKAEQRLNKAQEQLNAYTGDKIAEKNRLKNRVKYLKKNLNTAKKGIDATELIDISKGIPKELAKELGIKGIVASSYFEITELRDYGKTAAKDLDRMLQKMALSKDPVIRLEYKKLMEGNELNTVRSMLYDAEGKGVMVKIRDNWNPKDITYLDENKSIITAPSKYQKLSGVKAGDQVKQIINQEINKGLKAYLKGKIEKEVLAEGIIGKAITDWKQIDGLTHENVFEVANQLTDELLKAKVELPAYKLTPFKGYLSEKYVQDLTYLNSEVYRLLERFDLDPSVLSQYNILRNVTNPELAKYMKLINIQKNLDTTGFLLNEKHLYSGLDPGKVLNSQWFLNAPETNHALGFKLLSTDPLNSMAETLRVLPESLSVAAMMKSAIKTGDIRKLTKIEKVSFEVKLVVPEGKKLIKTSEITNRLEGIKDLVPEKDFKQFEKTLESFKEDKNLLISVGLDDQLQSLVRVKNEAPTIINYLNHMVSVWKKVVLITPGYHMRNMFGNLSQTVTSGIPMSVMTPELNKAYRDINNIHKITNKINTQLKTTKEILDTEEKFFNFTKSFLPENEHNLFHEYKNLLRHGITGQSKVNSDYWEMLNKLGRTSTKNSQFKKGWDTVFHANMNLSQAMDDGVRLATYRISLKDPKYALKMGLKGDTPEKLAQSFVRTTFFDYNALTSFEKNTMRKIFPFYTWSRKNLEYQVRTLINQPEKFGRMAKIFNDWNEAQGYNTDEDPTWVKDNMWLPLIHGDKVKFLKLGLPVQDLNEVFGGNGQILNRLNPFYKLVLESITGKNINNQDTTTPLKSLQGMFWQPIQKLLVQPFDIPLGALPLGNGKTFGELLGHPNDYNQKNSIWYEQNLSSLHQSYLWEQINKLTEYRQQLRAMGINIQTKQQLLNQMKQTTIPTKPKLQSFRQIKLSNKDLKF